MYIVEKYRPKRNQSGNPGTFRKCEKNFLAAREINFLSEIPFPSPRSFFRAFI
jgi:hypothetical protein